jgi:MSHA biogenesis protein MshL
MPVTRLDDRRHESSLDSTPAVSLSLSEPLPVRDVLLLLFKGTPFSIVFESSVAGSFQGELSDLTAREALEAVVVPAGLDYAATGSVIRVFARRPETRIFDVNHPNVARTWERRLQGRPPAGGSTSLTSTSGIDVLGEIGDGIRALLSESGRVHVDRATGLIQVTDYADRLERVGIFLEAVNARASRQVRLHARVLEVELDAAPAVDWEAVARRAGPAVRAGAGAGMVIRDFDALCRALASVGPVRVVAAPQVLATNNQPAVMRMGSEGSALPGSTAGGERRDGDGDAAAPSPAEGLTLTVIPQIGADGIVQMSVSPAYAARRDDERGLSIVEADTTLRVRQGETVVFSGLVREVTGRVPATGLAGSPGRAGREPVRRELVILLTPTIVTPGDTATEMQ